MIQTWFEKLGSWLWQTIQEVLDWVTELVIPLISSLLSMIPNVEVSTSEVAAYVNVVNVWVPLDLGMSLFLSYLAIEGTVLIIRIVIKLIPTVG